MPTSDGQMYSFKCVNSRENTDAGLLTVTAFGVLADGRLPLLLSG
jgi:ornithine cyclodeaminase/alanine dehydrogenase-like protein (mu-crystallin family)